MAELHHPPAPPAIVETRAPGVAGRGGRLLPRGYLRSRGAQLVDASGAPVRIAAIGWNGTDGRPGAAPAGLWRVSYREVLDSIRAAGFNTVCIPWTDAGLHTSLHGADDRLGWIHVQRNADLLASDSPDAKGRWVFVTALEAFGKIVAYAREIGLKVIFDHHSNEGTAGQQKNGLWFDRGPGSDGTDGIVAGTVDADTFRQNWLTLAKTFAGDDTVLGYDLHNEPNADTGHIVWGRGGPTDIKAMCETVGAAIQTIDPGPLIICEGPENYAPSPASSGMAPGFAAPSGNLTAAGADPVKLPIGDKLVYSVREYPDEISDVARYGFAESGPAYAARMTRSWGYLVHDDIAPVWIGEMGSTLNTPGQKAWARTLLDYMNGAFAADGGPVVDGGRQPVSGGWWLIGPSDDPPRGLQTDWGVGHWRPEQLAVTDRMLMR